MSKTANRNQSNDSPEKTSRSARAETRDGVEERQERVPLGRARRTLTAPEIPGYVLRWMNDEGNRLANAERGGWSFVEAREIGKIGENVVNANTDGGNRVSQIAGTDDAGNPMRAHLMKIKREWYEEDQAEKAANIQRTDDQIRRGVLKAQEGDGRYVPKEGIKYKT